jgi:hypothetical protein
MLVARLLGHGEERIIVEFPTLRKAADAREGPPGPPGCSRKI